MRRAALLSRRATAATVVPDALATSLAALEAAGKLVCAWFIPLNNPTQYFTLSGANVNAWNAAYGTQKVNLAVETAAPQWDATLFSNKGGVTFNGTTQRLLGTGNVTNWPDATADLYMLSAGRNDASSGLRGPFAYGDSSSTSRNLRVNGVTSISAQAGITGVVGASAVNGAHTLGVLWDMGGTSAVYLDGVSDGTAATASASLTNTRVRIGALAPSTANGFWQGPIVAAAILNSTASLTDFTALEALMRARLT